MHICTTLNLSLACFIFSFKSSRCSIRHISGLRKSLTPFHIGWRSDSGVTSGSGMSNGRVSWTQRYGRIIYDVLVPLLNTVAPDRGRAKYLLVKVPLLVCRHLMSVHTFELCSYVAQDDVVRVQEHFQINHRSRGDWSRFIANTPVLATILDLPKRTPSQIPLKPLPRRQRKCRKTIQRINKCKKRSVSRCLRVFRGVSLILWLNMKHQRMKFIANKSPTMSRNMYDFSISSL